MQTTVTITIQATPADIYPYLVEPSLAPRWQSGLQRIELDSEATNHEGLEFTCYYCLAGQDYQTTQQLSVFRPNGRLVTRETGPLYDAEHDYQLVEEDGQTVLIYRLEKTARGSGKLAQVLGGGAVRQEVEEDLARLKALVEGA
jgi:carbon monoxide dehydrogenase subunit G